MDSITNGLIRDKNNETVAAATGKNKAIIQNPNI